MYKYVIGLCVLLLMFFIFKLTSSTGEVVVDQKGEIQGVFNVLKEAVQGKQFWEDQAKVVNEKIDWELGEPQREAEWNSELRQMEREEEQELRSFYRENPDLRPSRAELRAERLRKKAERIEKAEYDRELEKLRLEYLAELRSTLGVVNKKIQQYATKSLSTE